MNDCKHSIFDPICMVCWWKTANGISIKDQPTKGHRTNKEFYKDCLDAGLGIGEILIDRMRSFNKE